MRQFWGLLNAVTGWHILCRLNSDGDRFSVVMITSYLFISAFFFFFADQQDIFPFAAGFLSVCKV